MWNVPLKRGWLEVICGSMFSGKTEELIRRIRLAQIAKQRVILLKPAMDVRYAESEVVSHNASRLMAVPLDKAEDLPKLCAAADVVGIDEAQFFGLALVPQVQRLADLGKRVIISGLDQDYRGQPFEPMPQLLALAEYITKNLAICMQCGQPANRSQRLIDQSERILLGSSQSYEARCRHCHEVADQRRESQPVGHA